MRRKIVFGMLLLFILFITGIKYFTFIKTYSDDPTLKLYFTLCPQKDTVYTRDDSIDTREHLYLLVVDENEFVYHGAYLFIKKWYLLLTVIAVAAMTFAFALNKRQVSRRN